MSPKCLQDLDNLSADGLWDRVRAEERADNLEQVAQDAARDAKLVAMIDAATGARRPS